MKRGNYVLPLLIAALVVPLVAPNEFLLTTLVYVFVFAVLAESWDLLAGYTGLLSFGHAAFFGIGAYTATLLSIHYGLSLWLGLLVGGATAAAFGVVVGYPTLRLKGVYFSLATLAFAETVRILFTTATSLTGGPAGLFGYKPFELIPYSVFNYYYLGLVLCVASSVALYCIANSKFGLRLQAIKNDDTLAEMQGINTARYKLYAFMISGFFAGMIGVFFAAFVLVVTPDIMSLTVTATAVSIAMIGGRRTIWGSIPGALIVEFAEQGLRTSAVYANLMLQGVIIAAVILFFPDGVSGAGKYIYNVRRPLKTMLTRKGRAIARASAMIIVIVIVVAGAGVAYYYSTTSFTTPSTKQLLIGVIGPMTGSAANLGTATLHGIEFAAYQVNKSGGLDVGGTKYYIKLIVADEMSTPSEGPVAFQSLVSAGVTAVVGEALTAVAVTEESVAQNTQTPFVVANANGKAISDAIAKYNYSYVFQTSPTSSQRGGDDARAILSYIPHPAKVLIVADDNDLGHDFASGFQSVINQSSPSTQFRIIFTAPRATDYSAVMLAIKQFQPTLVYDVLAGVSTNAFVQQEYSAGIHVLTIDGSSTPSTPTPDQWITTMGNASLYHVTNLTWLPSENETFANNFKAVMGYTPALLEIQAYDAAWTLFIAIHKAGSLNHAAIANALLHLNWKGGARGIDIVFNATTHTIPNITTLVAQVQLVNGKPTWVTIWPSSLAQGRLIVPPA